MNTVTPFFRDYELLVADGDKAVKIIPPFKIAFSFTKDITADSPAVGQVQLYNLSPSRRQDLAQYQYRDRHIQVQLSVGYLTTGLKLLFSGSLSRVTLAKQGTEIITALEVADGGYAFRTATISRAVTSKEDAFTAAAGTMQGVRKGTQTKQRPLGRPKIMTGFSFDELRKLRHEDEQVYIDNGQLHIVKRNEVHNGTAELISADTGLMETPVIDDKDILTFKCVLNPNISVGYQIALESAVSPGLNGVYRVEGITYSGESDTGDWSMTCKCKRDAGFIVVKGGGR